MNLNGERLTAAVVSSALVAVPFFMVTFPPITDLPQHTAQIRLFLDAVNAGNGEYRIQWFTPYGLSYALLGACWALFSPENAARVAAAALTVLWTVAVHLLAAARQRPTAAATLASVLVFNHVLYWGFLSFSVGWLAFVCWLLLTTRNPAPRFRWSDGLAYFAGAVLLYLSHALWFAFGVFWLVVASLHGRVPIGLTLRRLSSISPVILAAALWYPQLAAAGFQSETFWETLPSGRLSFSWIVDATLGGLYGSAEYLVMLVLLAWIGLSVWQGRGARSDRVLLLAASLLFALGFLLPDLHTNTIQFAARWMPPAAILLLLALPAPQTLRVLQLPGSVAMVAIFSITTAVAWMDFEREELSGLETVLASVEPSSRVLGLDFVKTSPVIKGRPFLQAFAYAQVLKGCSLNFSFAQFAPSLVVYRQRQKITWTPHLEWFAERVRRTDFGLFDVVIANAVPVVHEELTSKMGLVPLTSGGRWRLYRTESGS